MDDKILGPLCHRRHDYDGKGHSLRYASGGCVECRKHRYTKNKPLALKYNKEYWSKVPTETRRKYKQNQKEAESDTR